MDEEMEMNEGLETEDEYDFSDIDVSEEFGETESEKPEDDGSQTDPAEQTEEEKPESTEDGQEQQQDADEQPAEEMFDLKYNKETKQYTRQQVTELAQKGLNYDHILSQRDTYQQQNAELAKFREENEEVLTALESAASASGMDAATFLASIRENLLVQSGLSRDAAKERILRENAERKLTRQQEADNQKNAEAEAEARRKKDIEEFVKKYPDVNFDTIPDEVWGGVRDGETLVSAYGRFENKRLAEENRNLQQKLAATKKNEENKQKSLGSMKSTAKDQEKDWFLEGFNSAYD